MTLVVWLTTIRLLIDMKKSGCSDRWHGVIQSRRSYAKD